MQAAGGDVPRTAHPQGEHRYSRSGKAEGGAEASRSSRRAEGVKSHMRPLLRFSESTSTQAGEPGNIKVEVEAARERIAPVAGVPCEAVKISIDFGA